MEEKMKPCSDCGVPKELSEFHKQKKSPDGHTYICKLCIKKYKKVNKEIISEQNRKYKKANKERISEQNKKYREDNKERIAEYLKKYREDRKLG